MIVASMNANKTSHAAESASTQAAVTLRQPDATAVSFGTMKEVLRAATTAQNKPAPSINQKEPMNTSIQHHEPSGLVQPSPEPFKRKGPFSFLQRESGRFIFAALFAGLFFLLMGAPSARADQSPPGCTGSGLGIQLFTSSPDVHIGDTLNYSITVFNGTGVGPVVCDATSIVAFIVTPDGISHPIALVRTNLSNGQADFYANVVSYVVRAQDVQPDGTVRATATDQGDIHQNDTNSRGGGNQGVNTEVSLPCIAITVQCLGSVGENGALTFTGTVTNCGNNTLVGVTVTNFVNGGMFPVTFITNLARGQVASFSGSWIPSDACSPSTATLVAQGVDQFTTRPRTVTASANTTCSEVLTPGIKVTKACPAQPVSPGQLLTFSGSVSNTGNVTLTNVVVVDNQPAANTLVFTLASLAPGAVANFNGSYPAPTNCSVADTLTATATSRCGVGVSSVASATCPILTTPQIAVTVLCPVIPAASGGTLTYSGTVRNAGDITLNNIVVVSDRPAPNTTVFTLATLAPGATANFSSSVTVPANACSLTTTFSGRGQDICSLKLVTNSVTPNCPVATAPAIAVTLACPAVSATTGGLITYTGTVRNSGNVLLNNITVVDNQASPSTVLTVPSLAPGASANFIASFTAPIDACSVSSTVSASGSDNCTAASVSTTASATCTLVTAPRIVVTQSCPGNPTSLGGVLTYSGSVSNAGNITLTNVIVTNDRTGLTPVFTLATLAPGASTSFTGSYTVPANGGCSITSTLTAGGSDKCVGTRVTATAASTCPLQGAPNLTVSLTCPVTPVSLGGTLTFSGNVLNAGNVTLTNVVVTRDLPAPGTAVFTVATLAPGASATFTSSYTVPGSNACSITTSVTARGQDQCVGSGVLASATIVCPLVTTPRIIVTQNCSTNPTSPGGVLTYSGSVSNAGNITLSNIIVINNQRAPKTSSGPATFGTFTPPLVPPAGTVTDRFGVGNNFSGLTFATPDEGYAANQFYSLRHEGNGNSTFVTINANGTVTGRFDAGNKNFDALTFAAPDVGYNPNIFYYLRHDNAGVSTFGTIKPGGAVGVVADLFVVGNNFDALTFAATDVGYGANLFYYLRHDNTGRSIFGTINPALPGTVTDRFTVGTNFDALVFTATDVGYGAPNLFYYLRHDSTGHSIFGTITATGTVTDRFNVGTSFNELAFATTDVGFGANLFYYLHGGGNPQSVFALPSLAPGASTNFTGSYIVPGSNACSVTAITTVTGTDICSGNTVTNTITTTCPLTTTPLIAVTLNCPAVPAATGGLITYTGTVSNPGNVTLNNVTVVDNQASPSTVLTVPSLAPGASANFTASFTAPANACSVSSTATASGSDACTAVRVSAAASTTCPLTTTPLIAVTLNCPVVPAATGGLITYTGTVRNAGNITLNNVVVVDNQTSPGTVLTVGSLAPGASANFSASFTAPADTCAVSSTVTASGSDACTGIGVSATASATCPLVTTPHLIVNQSCPPNPTSIGGVLNYSGTVMNTGNITLSNVVVLNDHNGATPVLTLATLAPGASAGFTGSYIVPAGVGCSVSSISTASGYDKCTGVRITASAGSTCPVLTAPLITVTQTCPVLLVGPGGILTYSGTVSNAGNITLTNIVVVNNRPASNTVIFTVSTLAPGATANFTGSYQVPLNCCVVSSTVGATGRDICTGATVGDTFTATCTVLTVPQIVVTKVCPPAAVQPGQVLQYSGTISNAGNITLVNVTLVNTQPSAGSPVWGPITLAPGESVSYYASYLVVSDFCGTDTVTARGLDACSFAAVANSVTTTCAITTTPRIAVTKNCPAQPTPRGGVFTFTGTVSNPGNVTLTNVMVVNDYELDCYLRTNGPVIGPITLAPGASVNFSGSYIAPLSCCQVVDTLTASGQGLCSGTRVAATATAICPLLSTPRITVTKICPATAVPVGGLFTYTGSVSNAGDVVLTNVVVKSSQPNANTLVLGPIGLAPGESKTFSGSYTVTANSNTGTDTVTANGTDTCQGRTVAAMANCSGQIFPLSITSVTLAKGVATVTWTATPGTVYTLQCKPSPQDSTWISIPGNVTASGNTASKTDIVGSTPQRHYRVMVVQ
jgi:uncharacterized repeat protein (TIGR01451 family)